MSLALYEQRATRALGLGQVGALTLKWYLITVGGEPVGPAQLRDIEKSLAQDIDPAGDPLEHGVGFGIFHRARDGDYLLVSRWYDRNMLKHRVYRAHLQADGRCRLDSMRDTDIVACVWELAVMASERDAWVQAMQQGLTTAAVRGYLDRVHEGVV